MTAAERGAGVHPRLAALGVRHLDGLAFDLDGTLWDTTVTVAEAWSQVLRDRLPERPPLTARDVSGVMGLAHQPMVARLFPDLEVALRESLVAECYRREEALLRARGGRLYPQVQAILRGLAERYPLLIVSNCQRGYIESFLDWSGLGPSFLDWECHGNTGLTKGQNLRRLLARTGLRQGLLLGDTAGDQEAAQEAGVAFVHAAYGFGAVPGARLSVGSLAEFAALLLPGEAARPAGAEPERKAPSA